MFAFLDRNISSALSLFSAIFCSCISQAVDDANLVVAAIGLPEEELRLILADVQGQPCELDELGSDLESGEGTGGRDRWKKMYKLSEEELAMASLEDCVIMRMAVKDH